MKIPKPKKLASGLWTIQLRVGGESRTVTARTQTEAKRQAALLKASLQASKRLPEASCDLTVKQCQEQYIEAHRAVLSPSTVRSYKVYADRRWEEYQDFTVDGLDFQAMVNDELAKVSEKTVKNAWGLLHAALAHAGVEVPKVHLAKVPVNEIPFLQPEEIPLFVESVRGRSYEIPALLELHGLRLSEVRGLKWSNVDLKAGTIRINGAVVRGPGGAVEKKTNKTRRSTRTIPILIPALSEALERVSLKEGNVAPIGAQTLLDDVKRSCKRAGITQVGNHGLRHSFASLGYHLGISERQLMEWGGWDDIGTMHRIYIRLSDSSRTEAAQKMRDFFAVPK